MWQGALHEPTSFDNPLYKRAGAAQRDHLGSLPFSGASFTSASHMPCNKTGPLQLQLVGCLFVPRLEMETQIGTGKMQPAAGGLRFQSLCRSTSRSG